MTAEQSAMCERMTAAIAGLPLGLSLATAALIANQMVAAGWALHDHSQARESELDARALEAALEAWWDTSHTGDDDDLERAIRAYLAALAKPKAGETDGWKPTHMHRRGGFYRKIGEGKVEATLEPVTIYEATDGSIWTRPTAEFNDGRFSEIKPIAAAPVPPQ